MLVNDETLKTLEKRKKKKKYPNLVQLFVVLFVICNRYSLQLYLFLEGRLPFHLKHILFAISSSPLQDSSKDIIRFLNSRRYILEISNETLPR